jgi:hypothetical protein
MSFAEDLSSFANDMLPKDTEANKTVTTANTNLFFFILFHPYLYQFEFQLNLLPTLNGRFSHPLSKTVMYSKVKLKFDEILRFSTWIS